MEALKRSAPVPIAIEPMAETMDGYFDTEHKNIHIREGMSEIQTVSATVHEIAHSKLHDYKKNELLESKDDYQEIEVCGVEGLFSNGCIDRSKLPEGLYCYDVRGSDDDPGELKYLEPSVLVNHAGSIITAKPITLPENGRIDISEEINFFGGDMTLRKFYEDAFPEKAKKSRNTEEVEAESISFAVCAYYGIATGENSFGYIASWSQGKELKELKASLETINKTSSELITDIDRNFAEISKERGITQSAEQIENEPALSQERLYTVDDNKYLHVQRSDEGFDYTLYDMATKAEIDGGQLDADFEFLSQAALEICKLNNIGDKAPIKLTDIAILDQMQNAEVKAWEDDRITNIETTVAETPTPVAPLPDTPEQSISEPMPDPQISVKAMENFGYTDSEMLPLSKDRALELLDRDVTVYLLYGDNTEAMALDDTEIIKHDGLFGISREDWDAVKEDISPRDLEKRFEDNCEDSILIYQLKPTAPAELLFIGYDSVNGTPSAIQNNKVFKVPMGFAAWDRYSLETALLMELAELLERYMRRPDAPVGENGINAANAVSLSSDDAILALALKNQTFSQLWNGSANGFPSQSEADLALCGLLAFWTGKDPQRMDALFRKSGLMRPKWDERHGKDTYGALTVQKAIASCTKVFQPKQMTAFPPLRPLKQQCGDLPPFPVDCLPGTLRDYVKAVAAHSQTSEDMAAVIGLGVLAVCLQGKFLVQGTPGYDEPLSLYTVVIAAPGERKSSVMKDMTKCLYEYEQEFNVQREPEIRKSRQEREAMERQIDSVKDKLRRCEDSELEMELHQLEDNLAALPVVKPVRFFADDCSSEALTSLLANNGGVFSVISTEGGIFDIMAGRYSSKANIDVWLKGHCGDTIRVDRLGREPEYIPHPALSAILSIQPSVLEEIMSNATMTGRGLIARFLYASPPSRIGSRVFCAPPILPAIAENYRSMIFGLMAIPKLEEPTRLLLSDRATEIISDYFAEHEAFLAGEGQIISDWASKYIGAILRIAGLLHVAEQGSNGEISSEIMRNAIQIGSYFLAHSGYAYSMMGTDLSIKKALFVLGRIKRERITSIKRWELVKLCRGKFFKGSDSIQPTLELLENYGYIRTEEAEQKNGPGRKSDVLIVVNPAFYTEERSDG